MYELGVRMGMEKVGFMSDSGSSIPDNTDTTSGKTEGAVLADDDPLMKRRKRYLRRKLAENSSQSVGNGDVGGSGAQTPGELEAFISASDVTGNMDTRVQTKGRVESRGRRGSASRLPIWIRFNKHLQSKSTWNGGDKSGPQIDDKQMETPKIQGSS